MDNQTHRNRRTERQPAYGQTGSKCYISGLPGTCYSIQRSTWGHGSHMFKLCLVLENSVCPSHDLSKGCAQWQVQGTGGPEIQRHTATTGERRMEGERRCGGWGGWKDEKKERRRVTWNIGLQDVQETEGEGEWSESESWGVCVCGGCLKWFRNKGSMEGEKEGKEERRQCNQVRAEIF